MKEELQNKLIESIGADNIIGLGQDLGEIAIDSIIANDTLKEIPVISTLVSLTKSGINLRDGILMKKILIFLYSTSSLGYKEKKEFVDSVSHENKYRIKIGEQLLIILDRMDDLSKPQILGNLFSSLVKGNISYNTFLRLSSIISRTFTPDLFDLIKIKNGIEIESISHENLYSQGLLSIRLQKQDKQRLTFNGIKGEQETSLNYELNNLSNLLIKFGLN